MKQHGVSYGIAILLIGAIVIAALSTADYSLLISLLLVLVVALTAWSWGWKAGLGVGVVAGAITSPACSRLLFVHATVTRPDIWAGLALGFLVVGVLVGIRGAMFQNLLRANENLTLLSTVTTAVNSSLDLSQVQMTVLSQIGNLLHPDLLQFYELREDGTTFRLQASRPAVPDAGVPVTVAADEGLFAALAKTQAVAVLSASRDNLHLRPASVSVSINHLVAVPLRMHDHVGSVLLLGRVADIPFSPDDVRFLDAMGQALATAFENAKLFQQVKDLSRSDELTGVGNRRMFNLWMSLEVERSQLSDTPLSLAILDIDHFKRVNDQYGHAAGDAVLRQFAAHVKELVRTTDLFCRIGGEEFALATPGTSLEVAITVAERICATIAQTPFVLEAGRDIPVTVSIGVADLAPSRASLGELLAAADAALYRAKSDGRNRVCAVRDGTQQ